MEFAPKPNLKTYAMNKANETAPSANVITLREGKEIRKAMEDKLAEYKEIIKNSVEAPQGVLYGFALAEELLKVGTVNTEELKNKLKTIYPSGFDPELFKTFCEYFADMAVGKVNN